MPQSARRCRHGPAASPIARSDPRLTGLWFFGATAFRGTIFLRKISPSCTAPPCHALACPATGHPHNGPPRKHDGAHGPNRALRHGQNNTAAARAMADTSTFGPLSQRVATLREPFSRPNRISVLLRHPQPDVSCLMGVLRDCKPGMKRPLSSVFRRSIPLGCITPDASHCDRSGSCRREPANIPRAARQPRENTPPHVLIFGSSVNDKAADAPPALPVSPLPKYSCKRRPRAPFLTGRAPDFSQKNLASKTSKDAASGCALHPSHHLGQVAAQAGGGGHAGKFGLHKGAAVGVVAWPCLEGG